MSLPDRPMNRSPIPHPVRHAIRPVAAASFWLALVAWIAAITAPAAAAMVAFPRLAELEVALPGTQGFFADDPAAGGRFVAGYVTNPIFLTSDSIRLAAAATAWLAIVATGIRPTGRGRAAVVASLSVAAASIVLAWSLATVASPLAVALEQWRTAVLADDVAGAAVAKAAFDPLHVTASRLMQTELILMLTAVVAGAVSSASPTTGPGDDHR